MITAKSSGEAFVILWYTFTRKQGKNGAYFDFFIFWNFIIKELGEIYTTYLIIFSAKPAARYMLASYFSAQTFRMIDNVEKEGVRKTDNVAEFIIITTVAAAAAAAAAAASVTISQSRYYTASLLPLFLSLCSAGHEWASYSFNPTTTDVRGEETLMSISYPFLCCKLQIIVSISYRNANFCYSRKQDPKSSRYCSFECNVEGILKFNLLNFTSLSCPPIHLLAITDTLCNS